MSPARSNTPPTSIDEALRRSARHARNALAEALLAAHALLDAVSIALTGRAASAPPESASATVTAIASLSERIDVLARAVRSGETDVPEAWARALVDALDVEIARWEKRSQEDRDARAVLRAFLGLREILWEFGLREDQDDVKAGSTRASDGHDAARQPAERTEHSRGNEDARDEAVSNRAARGRRSRGRARVQRVEVDG